MTAIVRKPRIFPWRYGMFLALLAVAAPLGLLLPWHEALMAGFDIAALGFLASLRSLVDADAKRMRQNAKDNDANRAGMLAITGIVMAVILVAVGVAVSGKGQPTPLSTALLLATLSIAWLFSNMIYALHYAHIFYVVGSGGKDSGGIGFPNAKEPNYWDFIYFAFTLGMTFQTSDVEMTTTKVRQVAIFHCLAAFVFNLGILAFTINVLGGG
ncbi:MAG TPA: DUF1345 domain-containing protein [Sphingobium sp.]